MSVLTTRLRRALPAVALLLTLSVPALADPPAVTAKRAEMAAQMARIERGKNALDKAFRLDAVGLRLTSLKRAALTLRHARKDLRRKVGFAFEALTEEAEALLLRAHNGLTRLYLDREDLRRARENNAKALALDGEDATATKLATEILVTEARLAPRAPEPIPVAVERRTYERKRVASVCYTAPYSTCDRCFGSTLNLGYVVSHRYPCVHQRGVRGRRARSGHGRVGIQVRRSLFGQRTRGAAREAFRTGSRLNPTGHVPWTSTTVTSGFSIGVFKRRATMPPTRPGGTDYARWDGR